MDPRELARALISHMASGALEARDLLPSLRKLTAGSEPADGLIDVLNALRAKPDPEFQALASKILATVMKDAFRLHVARARRQPVAGSLRARLAGLPIDAPLGWVATEEALPGVYSALAALRDYLFVRRHRERAPQAFDKVERHFREAVRRAVSRAGIGEGSALLQAIAEIEKDPALKAAAGGLRDAVERRRSADRQRAREALGRPGEPFPDDMPEEEVLAALVERMDEDLPLHERQRLLDRILSWPTSRVAPILEELVRQPWAEDRAALALMIRFGQASHTTWEEWRPWLATMVRLLRTGEERLATLIREQPAAMLLLWAGERDDVDAAVVEALRSRCEESPPPAIDAFLDRWGSTIPAGEWEALSGRAPEVVEITDTPAVAPAVDAPAAPPAPEPPRPGLSPIWDDHLKPFFMENWYLVAGVLMFVVGSSVVAYYTWDKHWAIRYTLMPALLGFFTALLAWMGGWLERRDNEHRATAAILRGAAIALLPVNFMAVALLSGDPEVSHKGLAVPFMSVLYLGLFGWGLRKWCGAVHGSLALLLGGPLLLINALTAIGPAAQAVAGAEKQGVLWIMGVGFYLGFFAMAAAVVHFVRRVLTKELAEESRVVWFFGATLAVTFLQVFAWAHGFMKHLPQVHTYGPMVILSGALVLYVERRSQELRGGGGRHGAESFLGFAFVLLGLFMGASEPGARILAFLLAGAVWLLQAHQRQDLLHAWIGFTLAVLGGASVAWLPGFPLEWAPALGIALAVGMGATTLFLGGPLREAAGGMGGAVLAMTTIAAVILQAHRHSAPLITGGQLVVVAGLFFVRAFRDRKARWVQSGMAVLAVSLPYLGCMDLLPDPMLRGNTLVFGLAVLSLAWIACTARSKSPMILESRSTVLWAYGVLAVAAMLVRVGLEWRAPVDPLWYRQWMDYTGPLLMTAALGCAAWYSRSLVPAAMAVVIAAVLLPEMKTQFQATFPQLGWGSGLGNAVSAVALLVVAFRLRAWPRLRDLGEGDKYMGVHPFPCVRRDHTLFTWPLLAAALFFTVKVETWTFLRNLFQDRLTEKAAIALLLSGAAWTLFAVYHKSKAAGWLGAAWLLVGFAFSWSRLGGGDSWTTLFLATGLFLQGLYFLHRFVLERKWEWMRELLTVPVRGFLRAGSIVLAGVLLLTIAGGDAVPWLAAFLAAQLAWHALAARKAGYGWLLFALGWLVLLAWTAPGRGVLLERVSLERSLAPTLWMILVIHAVHVALEWKVELRRRLQPLLDPLLAAGCGLALLLGGAALFHAVYRQPFTTGQQVLLLAAVAVAARALGSGPMALLACLLAYVTIHSAALPLHDRPETRLQLLAEPWRLGALSLAMAAVAHAGRRVHARRPELLGGAFAPAALRGPGSIWLEVPAVLFAAFAAASHTMTPALRDQPAQLWAPFLGAAAVGVIAWSRGAARLHFLTGILLALGNVHAVRVAVGAQLLALGLSEIHLVCLGLAVALLQSSVLRRLARRQEVKEIAGQLSLLGAGLVLVLLSFNYLTHPDLGAVTWARFGLSGAMALVAGLYFRRAARRPAAGEERFSAACEGFYHFGVTMAFWCVALMVPALRNPAAALWALVVPVIYFYSRAEMGRRLGHAVTERYVTSAAVLGFMLLGLYAFRWAFHAMVFADAPFDLVYYHRNSSVVFLLGIVLLRLHALGGTRWLAFYGGLAVMTGMFGAVTALPGLSPFTHPVPAAACAVAMAHFWTVASTRRSPLSAAVQRLAALDGPSWHALRRPWSTCLLLASQGAVLWGLLDFEAHPRAVAPLLAGAASVFIHHGILRSSPVCHWIGRIQVVLALHAGFVLESHLAREHVVWALLLLWAALVGVHRALRGRFEFREMGAYALLFALLVAGHVAWHHPSSDAGLWAAGLGAALAALTPRRDRAASSMAELLAAAALPWVPAWLVYFSQAPFLEQGAAAALRAWPVLCAAGALFLTGIFAGTYERFLAPRAAAIARPHPRLFDQALSWVATRGWTVQSAMLWASFVLAAATLAFAGPAAFPPAELTLLLLLFVGLGIAWVGCGIVRPAMIPYFMVQLCVLGGFLAVRRQLMLTTGDWELRYDIVASLVTSVLLCGGRVLLARQPREVRVPFLVTLLVLPPATLAWALAQGMGSTWVMVVLGTHSVLFAYLGGNERESPYHAVATAGFTAFVLVLFGSALKLTAIHAYVVPVGVGILVLLQLFGSRVETAVRNGVRLVTLLAMLGSTAAYALFAKERVLEYNATLLALSFGAMVLGGVLRVRLYLVLGFSALVVDLVSLLGRMVAGMERSARMISIGSVVVAVGVALVFGAVYYKIHRARMDAWLERWKLRFAAWE